MRQSKADEIIITNKGRIEHTGTPIEIYHNPKTAFTASFFEKQHSLMIIQSFIILSILKMSKSNRKT